MRLEQSGSSEGRRAVTGGKGMASRLAPYDNGANDGNEWPAAAEILLDGNLNRIGREIERRKHSQRGLRLPDDDCRARRQAPRESMHVRRS